MIETVNTIKKLFYVGYYKYPMYLNIYETFINKQYRSTFKKSTSIIYLKKNYKEFAYDQCNAFYQYIIQLDY